MEMALRRCRKRLPTDGVLTRTVNHVEAQAFRADVDSRMREVFIEKHRPQP